MSIPCFRNKLKYRQSGVHNIYTVFEYYLQGYKGEEGQVGKKVSSFWRIRIKIRC